MPLRKGSLSYRLSMLDMYESVVLEVPRGNKVSRYESSQVGPSARRAGIKVKFDHMLGVDVEDRTVVDLVRVTRVA